MEELVGQAVDECGLAGRQGLSLQQLFDRLELSSGIFLAPYLRQRLERRLQSMPCISMEEKSSHGNQCVWLVADSNTRLASLGITEAVALQDASLRILESIAGYRQNGVLQSELSKLVLMDPKTLFHHMKPLKARKLLVVKQVSVSGTGEAQSTLRTNLLVLPRFAQSEEFYLAQGVSLLEDLKPLEER